MAITDRKPLAHVPAPELTKFGERRDIRRTFRFTETEDAFLQEGAVADRMEFSDWCRDRLLTSASMRHAERIREATTRMPARRTNVGQRGQMSDEPRKAAAR